MFQKEHSMLRLNHALPLALLVSVSAFAMEEQVQVDLVWKKNEAGQLEKVTVATASKPAMAVTWTKQEDGKFVATESTEVSKPLAKADRPVDLLSTIALSSEYTQQQSILNKLQQDKEAAIQAEAKQLDTLKAMVTELSRKLSAKQTAEAGTNLAIANFDKEIAKLQALKAAEIAVKDQTASDVEMLKKSIAQTTKDVAAAEAAKRAADAANKKSWSLFSWGKSTSAPVATAAPAAETPATPAAAETTATK
jgi:chromosome segregation ATPase